jgi:class 3 adenylate cyclase
MKSGGAPGRINISQKTYDYIKDDPDFQFEKRGRIEVKGKGEMDMWFVSA